MVIFLDWNWIVNERTVSPVFLEFLRETNWNVEREREREIGKLRSISWKVRRIIGLGIIVRDLITRLIPSLELAAHLCAVFT